MATTQGDAKHTGYAKLKAIKDENADLHYRLAQANARILYIREYFGKKDLARDRHIADRERMDKEKNKHIDKLQKKTERLLAAGEVLRAAVWEFMTSDIGTVHKQWVSRSKAQNSFIRAVVEGEQDDMVKAYVGWKAVVADKEARVMAKRKSRARVVLWSFTPRMWGWQRVSGAGVVVAEGPMFTKRTAKRHAKEEADAFGIPLIEED